MAKTPPSKRTPPKKLKRLNPKLRAQERRLDEQHDAERLRATAAQAVAEFQQQEPAATVSRAEARSRRLAELREKAKGNGTEKELFPTSTPFSFTVSYPMTVLPTPTPVETAAPVREGELASLAHEINTRLEKADKAEGLAGDHRLAAAIRLGEAKKICEARSMPFRKWAEAHIPYNFITVKNLARIGGQPDPKQAMEQFRLKNAEANKALRERKRLEVQALIENNPEVATAIEAARPQVEYLRAGGRFTGSHAVTASDSPIDVMLREFDRLGREAKAEFLRRAAEHMGALVELPE